MKTKTRPHRYLTKIGRNYFFRMPIPKPLRSHYGGVATHIKKSLLTDSKTVALIKLAELTRTYRLEFASKAVALGLDRHSPDLSWFEMLTRANASGDHVQQSAIQSILYDKAEAIEAKDGLKAATRWHRQQVTGALTLSALGQQWLAQESLSANTRSAYATTLREILAHFGESAFPDDVTKATAQAFVSAHWDSPTSTLKRSTVMKKKKEAVCLFEWLTQEGHTPMNPFKAVKLRKLPRSSSVDVDPKRRFTDSELATLLAGKPSQLMGDLMILSMYLGSRIEALCQLQVSNIELSPSVAWVTFTDDKTIAGRRRIPIVNPAALAVLSRRVSSSGDTARLFPELPSRNRISIGAMAKFKDYREGLGIEGNLGFHSFRHNVAYLFVENDAPPAHAERFLGHANKSLLERTYANDVSSSALLKVAQAIVYPPELETLALSLAHLPCERSNKAHASK